MKAMKKAVSLLLCVVMTLGIFSAANVSLADLADMFGIKAEAYTNTTIGRITQEQVVGNTTSIDGIPARDFWYSILAQDYFNGKSEPTNMVIPGLGKNSDYTPQGMTYWEAKNWILMSAYDAGGSDPTAIYAIDVASGKFVALFNIYNANGSVNTSHGGGVAASEHNFYFADSASNISYIPLSEMDVAAGTEKNITIKGTVSFAGELNEASTSYCCYDEGVLWVGNFYYSGDDSYKKAANASHNSMLLGYKLEGDTSQEEWDYLCGKYKNIIKVDTASGTGSNSGSTLTWNAFKNGDSVDITGNITAPTAYVGEYSPTFGSFTLTEGKDYILEFTSTNQSSDLYIFAPNGGGHTNVKQSTDTVKTQLEDGRWHYRMFFTAGLKPAGADSLWPTTQSTNGTYTGTYTIRFDQDAIQAGEARDFAMTDIRLTETNPNMLKLMHTSGTATKTGASMNYNIATNPNGSFNITGTASNTSGSKLELTSNYATVDLVEGETYTLEFISNNQLTDAYIFAPSGASGTHMRLFAQRGTSLGNGTYKYSTTFTAGKNVIPNGGGDYTWPNEQSTNGSFTGTYTIRFDQDDIQNNETRNFTISNISLKKTDSSRPADRIHFVGTAGFPTYVVAIPNTANLNFYGMDFIDADRENQMTKNVTMDKIQYAMVDNGRIYLSRSWSRKIDVNSSYLSEIDIIDIDLNVPGTYSLTINGATRNDCYQIDSNVDGLNDIYGFYNLSMGEALCVVDDYLYLFTESAAYNYRMKEYDNRGKDVYEEDATISSQPVDVVWKVDQYALMGETRPTAGEEPVETWEKVNSLDEINFTEEYMIVYESDMRDPATGQKIMYALDAEGGFKDGVVPKYRAGAAEQVDTGDSLGIVGHPISRYTAEGDIMTLYSPDADDKASLRWKIIGAGTGSMRLENQDSYYGNSKNLYIGSRLMYMSSSVNSTTGLDHLSIEDCGDGTFRFYYEGDANYYLWCNDGSNQDYMDIYSETYSDAYAFTAPVKAYAGQTEKAGTFHSDAELLHTNTGNLTGKAVNEKYQKMSIYRRASDVTSASGNSGLYTDLSAELQSDGTYTLTLESYTTGQTVTKTSTDGKPIDFVFVLDTSASMTNNNDFKFWGINDNPERYSRDLFNKGSYNRVRALKYGDVYYDVWGEMETQNSNNMYAIDIKNDRTTPYSSDYYFVGPNGDFYAQGSKSNKEMCNSYGLWKNEASDESFMGGFYHAERTTDRFTAMKMSTIEFIEQIAAHAEATGLQHRISIIQYGSSSGEGYHNTGLYSTTEGVSMVKYDSLVALDENYKNSFYPATHDNLITIIENLSTANNASGQDADTYVNHGFDMATWALASQILEYEGKRDYGAYNDNTGAPGSNANGCIITITDGVPGVGNNSTEANTVANAAIGAANTLKDFNISIHALKMGNPSLSGFDIDNYMNRLSSNYNSSGTSVDSKYYQKIGLSAVREGGTGMTGIFSDMFATMGKEVIDTGTDVALNASSVLQENLSEYFKLNNASATVKTASIYYDALGRIHEEAPGASSYTAKINSGNNTVQVTGFDYSSLFVSPGNTSGKKLYLEITGVELNDKNQSSVPVNVEASTAIYQTSNDITNNNPFQGFPQANVDIPQVTHVVDFGINMPSTSLAGTPLSLDTVTDKQSSYTTSLSNNNSNFKINSGVLNLSVEPNSNSVASSYALMQRPLGGYYWAKVNVAPASNVLFEETKVSFATGNSSQVDWSTQQGSAVNSAQTPSGATDVYGYDAKYTGANATYSNGTYRTATVNSSNKRSEKASFTFTGTGFDLISACGTNTGIQTVTVKQGSTVKKVYIVDTFYNDTTYSALTQVPVVHHEGDYGTYTIESTATYLSSAGAIKNATVSAQAVNGTELEIQSAPVDEVTAAELLAQVGMEELASADVELVWMDDDSILNGGAGAQGEALSTQAGETTSVSLVNYIDGFRLYNPLPAASQSAYISSESDASYHNVINSLASSSDIISGNGVTSFIGYVEKILGGSINFSDYSKSNAPKNEVYLTNNGDSALTFKVKLNSSSSRVMLGMRAAYGTPTVVINGNEIKVNGSNISSATEMYYDITEALTGSITGNYATITIKNTAANSILAVNNVKIVNGSVAALASDDIVEVASLMTMAVTRTIDVNSVKPVSYAELYPGHTPDRTVINPDPDLDIKGEVIITTPENNTNNDELPQMSLLEKIAELFKNLIAKIFSFLKSVFSMIPFFKEV